MILPNLNHFGHDDSCYFNNYRTKGAYPLGDSGAIACTIAGMIGGAVAG